MVNYALKKVNIGAQTFVLVNNLENADFVSCAIVRVLKIKDNIGIIIYQYSYNYCYITWNEKNV